MPPNPPTNSRLPRLAVWSGYGTAYSFPFAFSEPYTSISCYNSIDSLSVQDLRYRF